MRAPPADPGALRFGPVVGPRSRRLADFASRATLEPHALAAWAFAVPPVPADATLYRGIVCSMEAASSAAPVGRQSVSEEDAHELVLDEIRAAVDRALASVRRVAVLAGGGVDSALLLALVSDWARRTGGTSFAVALDFAGSGDDRPHMAALQGHLGCEVLRVQPRDASAGLLALLRGVDAVPLTWPSGPMEIEAMARARLHGAECVLTGVGGDQLFDGTPAALGALARDGRVRDAVTRARALRGFARPSSPVVSWVIRPLVAPWAPRSVRKWRARRQVRDRIPAWAGEGLAQALSAHARAAAANLDDDDVSRAEEAEEVGMSRREQLRLAWVRHGFGIAAGIARRDPYLDHPLWKSVSRLPRPWLLADGIRKGLLRRAMRGLVPESVRSRADKADFDGAFASMIDAPKVRAALLDLTTGGELERYGIVQKQRFAAVAREFVRSPRDPFAWTTIWPALTVEAFLRARDGRWP